MRRAHVILKVLVVLCFGVVLGRGGGAMAAVEYVTVGDEGNLDDSRYQMPGCGGVGYVYSMGKFEVTVGQYAEFLNAVAGDDTHGLYNEQMWTSPYGPRIQRNGSAGAYAYSTPDQNVVNRPVTFVSFWDACRFANWLHNGQATGAQDLTTTEDGAYFLNGVTNPPNGTISREPDAKGWVPSEDEWYKAAYYKGGGTNAGYWDYPTQTDTAPTAETPSGTDMANGSANYWDGSWVDPTYYTTEVGAYDAKPSHGAYGTFDQGGNVWEWNEAIIATVQRGTRGGSYGVFGSHMPAWYQGVGRDPTHESYHTGFRVCSSLPEPASAALLALGGVGMLAGRRRRRGRG